MDETLDNSVSVTLVKINLICICVSQSLVKTSQRRREP